MGTLRTKKQKKHHQRLQNIHHLLHLIAEKQFWRLLLICKECVLHIQSVKKHLIFVDHLKIPCNKNAKAKFFGNIGLLVSVT